jgi:hypothetical protein
MRNSLRSKEIKMKANSLFAILIVAALLAVTTLTVREALATTAVVSNIDSATRSYTDWAKAEDAEGNTVDSATRSYTAWAKSAESGNSFVPVTGSDACQTGAIQPNVDSATRSYFAWAKSIECR